MIKPRNPANNYIHHQNSYFHPILQVIFKERNNSSFTSSNKASIKKSRKIHRKSHKLTRISQCPNSVLPLYISPTYTFVEIQKQNHFESTQNIYLNAMKQPKKVHRKKKMKTTRNKSTYQIQSKGHNVDSMKIILEIIENKKRKMQLSKGGGFVGQGLGLPFKVRQGAMTTKRGGRDKLVLQQISSGIKKQKFFKKQKARSNSRGTHKNNFNLQVSNTTHHTSHQQDTPNFTQKSFAIENDYKAKIKRQSHTIKALKKELLIQRNLYSKENYGKTIDSYQLMKESKEFIALAFGLVLKCSEKDRQEMSEILKILRVNLGQDFMFQTVQQGKQAKGLLEQVIVSKQSYLRNSPKKLSSYYSKILNLQQRLKALLAPIAQNKLKSKILERHTSLGQERNGQGGKQLSAKRFTPNNNNQNSGSTKNNSQFSFLNIRDENQQDNSKMNKDLSLKLQLLKERFKKALLKKRAKKM